MQYKSKNSTLVICLHIFKWVYIYDLLMNSLLVILFLNELELIRLHMSIAMVKWFQLLLFNSNNSIQYQSFVCT